MQAIAPAQHAFLEKYMVKAEPKRHARRTQTMTAKTDPAYGGVWARNRPPGGVSHLAAAGSDRTICGVMTGDPAPYVTCRSCASRWRFQTVEGRRVASRAVDRAIRERVNAIALLAYTETPARMFETAAARFEGSP
jgi:hypothetical protein